MCVCVRERESDRARQRQRQKESPETETEILNFLKTKLISKSPRPPGKNWKYVSDFRCWGIGILGSVRGLMSVQL